MSSSIVNESNPAPAPSDPPRPVLTTDLRPLWVLGGVLLFALGALTVWLQRRRHNAILEAARPPAPGVPAHELALRALDDLRSAGLLESGQHLDFHMRLSEILRGYIGAHFQFTATEMTTAEILDKLRTMPDQVGAFGPEIQGYLSEMDLVKFARFAPPEQSSHRLLAATRVLVLDLSARQREREQALAAAQLASAAAQSAHPSGATAPNATAPSATAHGAGPSGDAAHPYAVGKHAPMRPSPVSPSGLAPVETARASSAAGETPTVNGEAAAVVPESAADATAMTPASDAAGEDDGWDEVERNTDAHLAVGSTEAERPVVIDFKPGRSRGPDREDA